MNQTHQTKYLDYNGLKYLWSKINGKVDDVTGYEVVRILLNTDTGGGVYTTVTVTVDGTATEYQYNGTQLVIKIPDKKSYNISLGDIPGNYITPVDNITYIAVGGSTNNLNYIYRIDIPGIFIVDSMGNLIDPKDWSDGSNATGVAVVSSDMKFCIAPTSWYQISKKTFTNGHYGSSVFSGGEVERTQYWEGLNSGGDETQENYAIYDTFGYENTQEILINSANVKGNDKNGLECKGSPAASFCKYYSNGIFSNDWYLPSYGEFELIKNNINEINSALNKISGSAIGGLLSNDHKEYIGTSSIEFDIDYVLSTQQAKDRFLNYTYMYIDMGEGVQPYWGETSYQVARPCNIRPLHKI